MSRPVATTTKRRPMKAKAMVTAWETQFWGQRMKRGRGVVMGVDIVVGGGGGCLLGVVRRGR